MLATLRKVERKLAFCVKYDCGGTIVALAECEKVLRSSLEALNLV